jgi:hypothetical protein
LNSGYSPWATPPALLVMGIFKVFAWLASNHDPPDFSQVAQITEVSCWCPVKAGSYSNICTLMFIAALFTTASKWKQCSVHPPINGYTKCSVCIQWDIIHPWKGMEFWHMLHEWTIKTC